MFIFIASVSNIKFGGRQGALWLIRHCAKMKTEARADVHKTPLETQAEREHHGRVTL